MWRHPSPRRRTSESDGKTRQGRRRTTMILVFMAALILVSLSVVLVLVVVRPGMSLIYGGTPTEVSHDGYETTQKTYIPEIQADMVVYRHKTTKTEVLTLVPKDIKQDSVFAASFRTIPSSDNGVAHMLEHSVLDGSEKYPTKDPFNEMIRGSLNTFLNAFTYPDRTVYTVASRNSEDFSNLVSVYLDAVFRPRCVTDKGSWILRQEGWRIEQDSDETLYLTGVVLNEMKGAYSDPDELIHHWASVNLFPKTSYRFDSGGVPSIIPTLSWNDFVAFYEKFYHPTNAQLYFYGPVEDIQTGMEQAHQYLQASDTRTDVRQESRVEWQEIELEVPVSVRKPYQSSNENDYRTMISWLVNDRPLDTKTEIAWFVVNELLVGTPTSPLEKALRDSGYGKSVIGGGLEFELQQWTFHVGMQGIETHEDVSEVTHLIMDTLDAVVTTGFSEEDVDSAMNTVEFSLRELNTDGDPRGLALLFVALQRWNYDQNPHDALTFESSLQELKDEVNSTKSYVFVSMIREWLLYNTHRVETELFPRSTVADDYDLEEQMFVDRLREQLTEDQFAALLKESKQLAKIQEIDDPPEILATIPTLAIEDIAPVGDEYSMDTYVEADVLVAEHPVESSFGILYVDFGLDMSTISVEDVPLIPLLARLMLESGTSLSSDVQLARKIGARTGGIDVETLVEPVLSSSTQHVEGFVVPDGSLVETKLFFRGKCTDMQASDLFGLLNEIIFDGQDFSPTKTLSILKEMVADLKDSVGEDGHRFASMRLESRYTVHGYIQEQLEGVTHLEKLMEALETAQSDWGLLESRLDRMKRDIISGHRNGMLLNLTGETMLLRNTQEEVVAFVKSSIPLNKDATPFPNFAETDHPWATKAKVDMPLLAPVKDEAIATATSVSYVGEGGLLYSPGEAIDGSAAVITNYLETGYLYESLRLERGAYGALARLGRTSGMLKLLSYRDPNLVETLEVYGNVPEALTEDITSTVALPVEATDAIIGTIGELDGSAPQPNQLGWISLVQYLRRETPKMRQAWREEILGTSRQDYLDFAERLSNMTGVSIAAVSSRAAIEAANSQDGADLEVVSIAR